MHSLLIIKTFLFPEHFSENSRERETERNGGREGEREMAAFLAHRVSLMRVVAGSALAPIAAKTGTQGAAISICSATCVQLPTGARGGGGWGGSGVAATETAAGTASGGPGRPRRLWCAPQGIVAGSPLHAPSESVLGKLRMVMSGDSAQRHADTRKYYSGLTVPITNNNVDLALRKLKRKALTEGDIREERKRRGFLKQSVMRQMVSLDWSSRAGLSFFFLSLPPFLSFPFQFSECAA